MYNSPITTLNSIVLDSGGEEGCRDNAYEYRFHHESNDPQYFGCAQQTAGLQPLRNGFYKMSIIENSLVKAYIYLDYRDAGFPIGACNPCVGSNDITLRWDKNLNALLFWNTNNIPLSNNNYEALLSSAEILNWADLNSCSRSTEDLPYFWANALVMSNNGNRPRIVWAPYPSETFQTQYFKIYKKKGTGSFQFLTTTTNYEYTDTQETIPTPPYSTITPVYYYVTAVSEIAGESEATNVAGINVEGGGLDKKLADSNTPNIENSLHKNYPNPFNPTTQISYQIKESGLVQLKIYNTLGKEVAVLVNETKAQGSYVATFDASGLASGVYFYSIRAGEFFEIKKMVLIK